MKTNKGCDLVSWKCGKGRAFTHIPANSLLFLKQILLYLTKENKGEKV